MCAGMMGRGVPSNTARARDAALRTRNTKMMQNNEDKTESWATVSTPWRSKHTNREEKKQINKKKIFEDSECVHVATTFTSSFSKWSLPAQCPSESMLWHHKVH